MKKMQPDLASHPLLGPCMIRIPFRGALVVGGIHMTDSTWEFVNVRLQQVLGKSDLSLNVTLDVLVHGNRVTYRARKCGIELENLSRPVTFLAWERIYNGIWNTRHSESVLKCYNVVSQSRLVRTLPFKPSGQ